MIDDIHDGYVQVLRSIASPNSKNLFDYRLIGCHLQVESTVEFFDLVMKGTRKILSTKIRLEIFISIQVKKIFDACLPNNQN